MAILDITQCNGESFTIHVIDTPGLADINEEDSTQLDEIAKGIRLVVENGTPSIHTMLYVRSAAGRFGREDKVILQYFDEQNVTFWSRVGLIITC